MDASLPKPLPSRAASMAAGVLAVAALGLAVFPNSTLAADNDDQMIVECRLPPQIRTLGRNATYLAAGRQVRVTGAECKVRGGSYNGRGPGTYAGQDRSNPGRGPISVTVGGHPTRDPCAKSGVVSVVQHKGVLTVRAGPGSAFPAVDRLGNGKPVHLCDWSGDGNWIGIVYADRTGLSCGLSKPIAQAEPYGGACLSGWVSSRFVK